MELAQLPNESFGPIDTGNTAFMLVSAALVLLMTPGLAFFYGGLARGKSVLNMMMMSFGALASISVVYVLWGFSMSFSDGITGSSDIGGIFANPFALFGSDQLMSTIGEGDTEMYVTGGLTIPAIVFMGFQLTFAVITVALISGALAERVKFSTWMVFTVLWATIVYFPLSHMVWGGLVGGGGLLGGGEDGLAAKMFGTTDGEANVAPIDFAGGTVVHINAGIAALVLVLIIGKRVGFGRTAYRPHNIPFVMLGAALLWFGWFGFNVGSELGADLLAGQVWVNTTAATAAAILGWLAVELIRDKHATSVGAASGVVAGLVAITAEPLAPAVWQAIVIGAVGAAIVVFAVPMLDKMKIDDVVGAIPVHLLAGIWGTFIVPWSNADTSFGTQIIGIVSYGVFTLVCSFVVWFILKAIMGLRVSAEEEIMGLDKAEIGVEAYPEFSKAS